MFRRTIDLLGEEGHRLLRRSLVVVVGLGGVGSHTVTALARAGVGRFRLVDADVLTTSSLNRHGVALEADVGRAKTEVMRRWLEHLGPPVEVECLDLFAADDTYGEILTGDPDLVVDAIDSVGPKTGLLAACVERGIAVVSSMGASSRTDPAQIRVGDLAESTVCPLARRVRKYLRRRGVERGITVVYSTEKPQQPLPPDEEEPTLVRGRVRNRQPSISTLPGIFGYAAANAAILELSGFVSEQQGGDDS